MISKICSFLFLYSPYHINILLSTLCLIIIATLNFVFYTITLAPNGMKESLAILKNCIPNGIPTIVMHQIQPTIRFPSAISHPKNIIHIRFTRNENMPFPYTISFPNGQNARVANFFRFLNQLYGRISSQYPSGSTMK